MLRTLIETFIDAICYCFGISRMKDAKRLKDTSELYEFMKQQKELAAKSNYFACC